MREPPLEHRRDFNRLCHPAAPGPARQVNFSAVGREPRRGTKPRACSNPTSPAGQVPTPRCPNPFHRSGHHRRSFTGGSPARRPAHRERNHQHAPGPLLATARWPRRSALDCQLAIPSSVRQLVDQRRYLPPGFRLLKRVRVRAQHALAQVVEDHDARRATEPAKSALVQLRPYTRARSPRQQPH